jgi:hypothetical protein
VTPQGAADKEEILGDIKRIQDNNNKSYDSSILSEKVSTLDIFRSSL